MSDTDPEAKKVRISQELARFLLGEAPLTLKGEELWYGERPAGTRPGRYWWRRRLRKALDAAEAAETSNSAGSS